MVPYELIRSHRKTVSIIVHRDGRVVVRAPLRLPEPLIREFVVSKSDWIRAKQAELARQAPSGKRFEAGELFHFLGKTYPLAVSPSQRSLLTFSDRFILSPAAVSRAHQVFMRWYKARAAEIIPARVKTLADKFGFSYQRIRISSARTRWGSCSTRGTISISWRLVMAPPEVLDYVIVHELAHLKEHNHSRAFWAQVEAMMPDYRARRDWLKKNGHHLALD